MFVNIFLYDSNLSYLQGIRGLLKDRFERGEASTFSEVGDTVGSVTLTSSVTFFFFSGTGCCGGAGGHSSRCFGQPTLCSGSRTASRRSRNRHFIFFNSTVYSLDAAWSSLGSIYRVAFCLIKKKSVFESVSLSYVNQTKVPKMKSVSIHGWNICTWVQIKQRIICFVKLKVDRGM